MRLNRWMVVAVVAGLLGCGGQSGKPEWGRALTAQERSAVEQGVRGFLTQAGQDVSRDGPAAWRKAFSERPEFFMASEGKLVFANGPAAMQGIDGLTRMIRHIELRWGKDLKIDALTPELAVVGTSWEEDREDSTGHMVKQSGYFTGLVEKRDRHWVFRDAHWSVGGCSADTGQQADPTRN